MASEILTDAINDIQKDGGESPVPTEDNHSLIRKAEKDFGPVAFIMAIMVMVESPIVRISMTIPQNKLDMITEYAKQRDTTRSALMIEATMDYMKRNE